jgi:hypothetical protein
MDCKTARLILDLASPNPAEMQGSEAAALETHLGSCPDCDSFARIERQVEDRFGQAMRDVPVPAGLNARLLQRLGRERRAYYRRVGARVAPVAATVLLLLGLGLWWHFGQQHLLVPDPEDLVNREFLVGNSSAKQIEELFKTRNNVPMAAPLKFNEQYLDYTLLMDYGLVELNGQRVPMLLFVKGPNRARIYVVSGKPFDVNATANLSARNSLGFTFEARQHPETPNVVYLLVYSGDSLQPFLSDEPRNAE